MSSRSDARFDALAALVVALSVGVAVAAAGAQEAQAAAPHVAQDALGLLHIRVDLRKGVRTFELATPVCYAICHWSTGRY